MLHLLLIIKIEGDDERRYWERLRIAKVNQNHRTERKSSPIVLSNEDIAWLAKNTVDVFIFAKENAPTIATQFPMMFAIVNEQEKWKRMKISKELDSIKDNSINRCIENQEDLSAFLSDTSPRVGTPSPGSPNFCTGNVAESCETNECPANPQLSGLGEEIGDEPVEDEMNLCELSRSLDSIESFTEELNTDYQIGQQDKDLAQLKRRLSLHSESPNTPAPSAKKNRLDENTGEEMSDDQIIQELDEITKETKPWKKILLWNPELENAMKEKIPWFNKTHVVTYYGTWLQPIVRKNGEIAFKCFYCYNHKEQKFAKEGFSRNNNQITAEDLDNFEHSVTSNFAFTEGWYVEFVENDYYKALKAKGDVKAKEKMLWRKFREKVADHAQQPSHVLALNSFKFEFKKQRELEIKAITAGQTTGTDALFRQESILF